MHASLLSSCALAAALFTAACTVPARREAWPEPRPLGGEYPVFRPPEEAPSSPGPPSRPDEPEGEITLEQALGLALLGNPGLAAFSWEVRAAEARALQAGLLPNPSLDVELEEFGGTRERSGLGGAETSVRVGQMFLTAGKRKKRTRVADLGRTVAALEWETKRLDVVAETMRAFTGVLAAQEQVALAEEAVRLSEKMLRAVSERVQAGKVSPLEESKARVALASVRIAGLRARRDLEVARRRLAAAWGGTEPRFTRAKGAFEKVIDPPPLEKLLEELSRNPRVARRRAEVERRRAAVELEEARAVPDPTLSAGVRHYADGDSNAFILGLSVPMPFFDRNQGGVAEARHGLAGALAELDAETVAVRLAMEKAYRNVNAACMEVRALEKEVLPAAEAAFSAAREGYLQGKFGYIDLLDAQRTLVRARSQYIQALAAYHAARSDLERLAGKPIGAWTTEETYPPVKEEYP